MLNTKLDIIEAQVKDMDLVREFFREYQAWLNVDICFQGFEEELASLPGRYAPPKGAIYLVFDGDEAIACAAIRPRIDTPDTEAEFKRLFVRETHRSKGIGKKVFNEAMKSAKQMGYKTVVLETLPIMKSAKYLYQEYGFKHCDAYFENADESVEFYRYSFDESE